MPDDTTPHGGEAFHPPPQRARIPDPPPQATDESAAQSDSAEAPDAQAIARRPALPVSRGMMPADREDEDADPVTESGPVNDGDLETGRVSVTRQPGV